MSKVMGTSSLGRMLERAAGEYAAKDSIYEIPGRYFKPLFAEEAKTESLGVMSGRASFPVGPAAGPHTQIAPNILAAYLAGSRVFELKTVQENDRLDIEKPCIEALDEGHNVEWSTELSLEEARREYINGYLAVQVMAAVFSPKPRDFFFNASVGYTLQGIRGPKVDAFIEGLRRPELHPSWDQTLSELRTAVDSDAFVRAFGEEGRERARRAAASPAASPIHSITLSTMHGCPPEEIGRIGRYLIEEKGFDVYIKLNPTLIGYDEARRILDALGWERIRIRKESFEHDLQFADALELIRSLDAAAKAKGRSFGIKLSNTLANENSGGRLPGAERYMSGRALFPITARLAARLAAALPDYGRRFSYCGGVSAFNAAELVAAGMGPLTLATDILKPGGYLRLGQIARLAAAALPSSPAAPDASALERLAEACLSRPEYRQDWKEGEVSIRGSLPLMDCFAAPCERACPVHQKVPAYVAAEGSGESDRALAIVLSDNALPRITGMLCDHVCQERCSRLDYEGPVRIRDVKLEAALSGKAELAALASLKPLAAPAGSAATAPAAASPAGLGTAILGAGPAGLACARELALMGRPVTIFDPEEEAGGVPSHTIPHFRIGRELIDSDISAIEGLGVVLRRGERPASADELFALGYTSIFLAAGAEKPRTLRLGLEARSGSGSGASPNAPEPAAPGLAPEVLDALTFLRRINKEGPAAYSGAKRVVVAGGGNTACDAVRAACRIPGIREVRLSYRRSLAEMPADKEELGNALLEAGALLKAGDLADASKSAERKVLHELSQPEALGPGSLRLRAMELGEPDASGRRSPLPTDKSFSLDCDLVVLAIGEQPDPALLKAFGFELDPSGLPIVDPETLEGSRPGVYAGGDIRRGPSSIISAQADGIRAARAILASLGAESPASDYVPPAPDPDKLALRGMILPSLPPSDPGFAAREAERCLSCDSACLRCVEVCPNRANLFIPTGRPFAQAAQILHLDELCNECGNCGFFCPWEGKPFADKPSLFRSAEALDASKNAGFAFLGDPGSPDLYLRALQGEKPSRIGHAQWNGAWSPPGTSLMIALAREIFARHRYLVEEGR